MDRYYWQKKDIRKNLQEQGIPNEKIDSISKSIEEILIPWLDKLYEDYHINHKDKEFSLSVQKIDNIAYLTSLNLSLDIIGNSIGESQSEVEPTIYDRVDMLGNELAFELVDIEISVSYHNTGTYNLTIKI